MTLQIHPSFVNEAYSLLRQSIIHVDQDDIDFDDDALPGTEVLAAVDAIEAEHNARQDQQQQQQSSSLPAEPDSLDAQAGSMTQPRLSSVQPGSSSTQPTTTGGPSSEPAQPQPKPKMKITYDEFMSVRTLVLLELAERERTTGKGMNRDDILLWWIEQKEKTLEDVVDIEYQEELMRKVLTRLVKVCTRSLILVPRGLGLN